MIRIFSCRLTMYFSVQLHLFSLVFVNAEFGTILISTLKRLSLAALSCLLLACTGTGFKLQDLAKTDTDMVVEAHYKQSQHLLRELAVKLYKRNPKEWRKSGLSLEKLTSQLFDEPVFGSPASNDKEYEVYQKLNGVQGVAAIEAALSPVYQGDRVFALVAGLNYMIRQSYDFQAEFYVFSEIDEQKLYLSARNLEATVWRLSQRRGTKNQPLLLTNSLPGETANLSYERLFGKLIAVQDMLAIVMAQKNKRVINKVAQNIATMAFFPL